MRAVRKIYAFDDFQLDDSRFELRKGEQRVSVQPKVLKLLLHLAAQRHRAVPLQELLTVLWPDETVTTASVKRAINGARRVLGDSIDSQNSIRTVRGRGYQFVRDVRELDREAQSEIASAASAPVAHAPPLRSLDDVFVGRDAQLAKLAPRLSAALAGNGKFLLLVGEAGVGKTRLVRELAQRATELGAERLLARCEDIDGAPAFWPWRQIFRQFVANRGYTEAALLMGVQAPEILEAMPELGEMRAPRAEPPPIDSAYQRFRVFDALVSFLRRAAAVAPLFLWFDDLHRADPPTIRLLIFLTRQLSASRILLVGTMRPASEANPQLSGLLDELTREDPSGYIELSALKREDVAQFLDLSTGGSAPNATVDRLYEQTGGNALFCKQILCAFLESDGALAWDNLAAVAKNRGLLQVIERRLESLSEPCRTMLRRASVVGREFSLSALSSLCSDAPAKLLDLLGEAMGAELVSALDEGIGRYRFIHAVIQQALYEHLSDRERSALHLTIADALEQQHADIDDSRLSELAFHFTQAAALCADERPLTYSLRAADAALARLAYEEAVALFDRALELLNHAANAPEKRLRILLAKGEALARADDAQASRDTLLTAAALARRLGSPEDLRRAAVALARAPESGLPDRERIGLLEEVLAGLPKGSPHQPLLEALLAKSLLFSGTFGQRTCLVRSAVSGARKYDDPKQLGQILHVCHYAMSSVESLEERMAISRELFAIAQEVGDHELLMQSHCTRIRDRLEIGDLTTIDEALVNLRSLSEAARQPFFRWLAHVYGSMRALVAGDMPESEREAESARELGQRVCERSTRHVYVVQTVAHLRMRALFVQAEELTREIMSAFPALGGWRATYGSLQAYMGRDEIAREALASLIDSELPKFMGDPHPLGPMADLAELCAMVGTEAQAELVYRTLLPFESRHGVISIGVGTHGPIARHLGALAAKFGDFTTAEQHFRLAIEAGRAMPSPTFLGVAFLECARMLLLRSQNDDRARASAMLRKVLQLANPRGMMSLIGAAFMLGAQHQISAELQLHDFINP